MKPIHLNLASRPYRDYTPVNVVAAAMFVLMLVLAWVNINTALRYNIETKSTRAKIEKIEADTEAERKREQMAQQRLAGLDLNRLSAQTEFVNAQLVQRAFSWSTLLDELESVLADDVRIITIAPSFAERREISLALTFDSKTAEGMMETINSLNADPQFRDPFPSQETKTEQGSYAFALQVTYIPPAIAVSDRGVSR